MNIEVFLAYLAGIVTVLLAFYFYFKSYKKIVLSINLDEIKDAILKILEAVKDAKLSFEEKKKIIKELKEIVDVETRVVRIEDLIEKKSAEEVKKMLENAGLKNVKTYFSDGEYYTIPYASWMSIVKNDFLERKKWIKERFDCDSFSKSFVGRMNEHYQINGCGEVWGMTPGGYHSWVILITPNKLLFLETQTDEIFEVGEKGYQADTIFL